MQTLMQTSKGAMNVQGLVAIFIAIIVGVLGFTFYLGQTPSVLTASDTSPTGALENLSGTSKSVADNLPLFYIIGALGLIAAVGFGVYKSFAGGK